MAKKNKLPAEIPTKDIERVARENGLEIRPGKGSHMKIIGPAGRGYMIYEGRDKKQSAFISKQIRKWFLEMGIVITLVLVILNMLGII